ncbi:MAG: ribosome small subunit-dependent GTPase A [Gammaproteobacteria bacterium]|nr:ribosome small subunit-dependent GTPase A [Gammaproteobacteria bacterium]
MTRQSGCRCPAPSPGRIIASHGPRVVVEDEQGQRHRCRLSGRKLRAVCGDRAQWRRAADDSECLVTAILPRENALGRPDKRGRVQVIAANLTQLIAVVAPSPPPDLYMLDRYLAAAALLPARALIVLNKAELSGEAAQLRLALKWFTRIGYAVLETSAQTGAGMEAFAEALEPHTSILLGQSGVGKSSLLNRLLPDVSAATAEISAATGEGRHTTVVSVLHHLPRGGDIIDSPGVRDYAPPPVEPVDVARAFIEFGDPAAYCRFSDCMHLREPGCGVREAVESGAVDPRRYESYRRLLRLMRASKWGHS